MTAPTRRRKNLWFERGMAIAATVNLLLILFDLTYVSFRNFWLLGNVKVPVLEWSVPLPLPPGAICSIPGGQQPDQETLITRCYDWIKGIEPHRDTEYYLATVNRLKQQVQQQGTNKLKAPEIQATLKELGQLSGEMISSNPFAVSEKNGTLEKIKNLMRDRLRKSLATLSPQMVEDPFQPKASPAEQRRSQPKVSATDAFRVFWSPAHLNSRNWDQEIRWFDDSLRPLIQTNYFRSIAETGAFTNQFWKIDLGFWLLFLVEFLARTYYLSRRHPGVKWLDAMVWRWYDLPLIFPFGFLFPEWAWLRVFSTTIRLHQAHLIDLDRIKQQATQGFVGSIAEELTEVVVVQVINQTQDAIRRGDMAQWLQQPRKGKPITVNNVDEVAEIATLLVKLTVYQVLPKIQPELSALVQHNVDTVLNQTPAYRALKNLPGFDGLTTQLGDRLIAQVLETLASGLSTALEDGENAELSRRLVEQVTQSFRDELQEQNVLKQIQSLLTDLLEEVKLNYVQQSTDLDVDAMMQETRQLRQIASRRE